MADGALIGRVVIVSVFLCAVLGIGASLIFPMSENRFLECVQSLLGAGGRVGFVFVAVGDAVSWLGHLVRHMHAPAACPRRGSARVPSGLQLRYLDDAVRARR